MSIFNELLIVESFIKDKFSDIKILDNGHRDNIFINNEEGNAFLSDKLYENSELILQALTSPTANRDYDYERLEFYGDSVISFLVIVELFLTKPDIHKEGELDL